MTRDFSFFFKERGAGLIDGRQIGEFLGAKLNPTSGYEDDICIYAKCQPPEDCPKHSFVNVVDGVGLIDWIQNHPWVGVIATSITSRRLLINRLGRLDIYLVPEHHCNIERIQRDRKEVTTVGAIGNLKGFVCDVEETRKEFAKIGLDFKFCDDYKSRQDVIDFYKTIDLQMTWRPHVKGDHAQLHNPLKLANAASFGIPTIAYPEENYKEEFNGCFMPAPTLDKLFDLADLMKDDPNLYKHLVRRGLKRAEEYHIEKIALLYKKLGERL